MRLVRRRAVLQTTAAALGLIALGDVAGPSDAQGAALWSPGPRSGLPYWLGGFSGVDELNALMRPRRSLDLVHYFERQGDYQSTAAQMAADFDKIREAQLLISGAAVGLQWSTSPFCYGAGRPPPAVWPTGPSAITPRTWLSASRPPTFTGSESAAERTAKQRRAWRLAADGWLDPVWRYKLKAIKRDCFVRKGLRSIRIVLRVAHELNLKGPGGGWGRVSMQRSHGIGQLTDPREDPYIVQEGLRRYIAVFLDVFGRVQADIAGDFAYRRDQLWPYWCPIPEQFHPFDVSLTCPPNAGLAGPDVYDFWMPSFTRAQFEAKANAYSRQGWPKGMRAWADWASSTGRLLAIGEFGLVTWTRAPDGGRPAHEGWDNPAYLGFMLDFFHANADRLAFASYFNRDYAPEPELPASYMAPWPGIDDSRVPCARLPVGDNNRCGARMWRRLLGG